jgi:hypothetical protein
MPQPGEPTKPPCRSAVRAARCDRAGDDQQAEDVGVEHRADLVVAGFLCGAEQSAARVVDKDVDPAEGCRRGVHRSPGLPLVCHVEGQRKEVLPYVGEGGLDAVEVRAAATT